MKNDRDIFRDGHGFVNVPIGRSQLAQREYRYSYDLALMPTHKKPFLGLYITEDGKHEPRIVIRAQPHRGLRLLSYENHHYLADPIAWAELPTI